MKKTILLTFTVLMMIGCDVKQQDGINTINSFYETYTVDSCEYVGYVRGSRSDYLTHKGNCRFCKERRQEELKELVEQLKEK